MAEKDAEKQETGKDVKKGEASPDEQTAKKRKLFLFLGIGGVVLIAIIIGVVVMLKTMAAKKHALEEEQAQAIEGPADSGHGSKPAEQSKKEEKKDDKKDDHKKDEKKDDKKDDHKKDDKKNDGKKDETKGTANFGDTYVIPKMDLNLGNPIENRFLRLAVAIEYRGGDEQMNELKKRDPQIKDIIITTVTNKTRMQLLSENGKELLRREILNKINEVADKPVQNVFFTEFLLE